MTIEDNRGIVKEDQEGHACQISIDLDSLGLVRCLDDLIREKVISV